MSSLPRVRDERLLVGYDTSDDACVYKINDSTAIVQTVDFFPPIVDDPYLFGQIAAANAFSDIYAMGAVPTHAMNLLCFPNCLGLDVAGEILKGGADKAREAGCGIAGGHTIYDNEPKYGLCVNGIVDPGKILLNSSAREGDVLVLTKPLGTGIITTAYKAELVPAEHYTAATESMRQLNRYAAEAARGLRVHACTDITGFGFAGHVCEMAEGSSLTALIDPEGLPLLPGAADMARMGMIPGGAYRNRDHFEKKTDLTGIDTVTADLMFDPQTSGGLLFAIEERDCSALLARLRGAGVTASLTGRFVKSETVCLRKG